MLLKRNRLALRQGFTLTEIAIVLGIIGLILGAIWSAAGSVYMNLHLSKAATETLMIVQSFKTLYGNRPITDPNGEDMTAFAMSAGLFPADMVQAGNTTYALGPWSGSQVNVYSGSVWDAITVAFWNIDVTTCNRLADTIATGNTFPSDGLVWEGVNNTYRTLPPFGTDVPFTVSDVATACASGGNINVQVTYTVN